MPGKSDKKRGRTKSWIHDNCAEDEHYLVCQVVLNRRVAGKDVAVPCGKKLKYLTGTKLTPSPRAMTEHLASAHGLTKERPVAIQETLVVGPTGQLKIDRAVVKWSTADLRTVALVETIAK